MSGVDAFPTRYEMKCSGCSFLIAQLLLIFAITMQSIDYDLYTVNNDEDVIRLHNLLSSTRHRTQIEIAVSAVWISFPLLLIGLFGIKKAMLAMYKETGGEMLIFAAVQSYIIFITIVCVLHPAISLTASSFEWSLLHQYDADQSDIIPTGYYVQLYLLIFNAETLDCVAIADAVFMISLFLLPRLMINDNAKFKKLKAMMDDDLPNCLKNIQCLKKCYNIMIFGFVLSLFVIFCIVLFEFAESGFFSPTGHAKFVVIWSFILKIIISIKIIYFGYSSKYDQVKNIFIDQGKQILSDQDENYKMEKINLANDNKETDTL